MFKKISSKTVYKNKWMEVFEDEVEFPDGREGIYGYIKRSDGAGIAIVNDSNEILLIKQYRYPVGKVEWNIPGGALDGKDSMTATLCKLKEETGIEINSAEKLMEGYPLSSGSTEKEYIYFAKVESIDLTENDVSDYDEYIEEKKFIPIKEAIKMIDNGEISDLNTCNVIQIVARKIT